MSHPQPPPFTIQQSPPRPRKSSNTGLIITIILAIALPLAGLAIAVGAGMIFFSKGGPQAIRENSVIADRIGPHEELSMESRVDNSRVFKDLCYPHIKEYRQKAPASLEREWPGGHTIAISYIVKNEFNDRSAKREFAVFSKDGRLVEIFDSRALIVE